MTQAYLTLSELNLLVKEAIKLSLDKNYWIVAEISEIRENYSGHCYLEFIQKSDLSDKLVAKSRANIWAGTYRLLKPYFESSTGVSLSQGMKVLVNVSVEFHELYGFSLNVVDIDPAYTLGDMEQKRTRTIQQLVADGVFDMNHELDMPLVPQRIAVISSDTAAGYGDFISQLDNNDYGFVFYSCFFRAFMQGDNAESSIMNALDRIFEHQEHFDVVVIIRGGGSRAELSCFDSYDLSSAICQFPLPVIAGIGHERDQSVVDMVAHTRVKTPTAAAALLIEKTAGFLGQLVSMADTFAGFAEDLVTEKKHILELISGQLTFHATGIIQNNKEKLGQAGYRFSVRSTKLFSDTGFELYEIQHKMNYHFQKYFPEKKKILSEKDNKLSRQVNLSLNEANRKLISLERVVNQCIPENIFKKGFSITIHNGKIVKSSKAGKDGDQLTTIFADGEIHSIISNPKS